MHSDPLKLIALDRDDLEVISAHLQDAVTKVGEILWRPAEHRVVIALNRFDWEAAQEAVPAFQRRRTALRFDRVMSCKCRDLDCGAKEQVLNLLAVEFSESDAPGGIVTLLFSGGGALRLEVECLEAEAVDLGPVWTTVRCPHHTDSEAQERNSRSQ
ncbi:MAG: DUF2948 family protein [Pseudorhodoplanes sp.]|jgi:hypothetical protein|nr:DUF2948 family protein [Pseudorhodoplanes sp.]